MGLFHEGSTKQALSLLCIDDDAASRQLITEYGGILDWVTSFAMSVTDGVMLASQNAYDAIITDHDLGDRNGFDLIRTIRHGDGLNSKTPVLMCTGRPLEELAERLDGLNVEAFLQKPLSLTRFEHAVLGLLDERVFTLQPAEPDEISSV